MASPTDSPLSKVMLGIENAAALDDAVRAAEPVMAKVTANPTVKDTLQGRWLGHALHPWLVMVPIGSWLSATLLDVSGVDLDGRAARRLVGVGIVSFAPSALTGWAELHDTGLPRQRVGVVHAAINGAALGLQAGSWLARRTRRQTGGRLLSVAALALVASGGFLGGHLSVARKVGSRDRAFERD